MSTTVHLLKLLFMILFTCLWSTPHAAGEWWNLTWAGDSLKPGDTLNCSSYLTSLNKTFSLWFFPWGNTTKSLSSLGISDFASNFLVWSASPSNPIANDSGVLTLDNAGTLKITRLGSDPIVLHSSSQPTNNTVAILLDSGNFVLRELHSNGTIKQVLWQSFDYPTNILLQGMKLGISHSNSLTWSLTSWLSDNYPDTGPFTLRCDPNGRQLIIQKEGVVYWESGVLRGTYPSNLPDETRSLYDFFTVSNEDEEYFSFINKNKSKLSKWVLTPSGQLKDLEGPVIARVDACDGYNTNGGCKRWECKRQIVSSDPFDVRSGYFVEDGDHSINLSSPRLGFSDCRATCLSNCSYVAFATLYENGTGCRFWTDMSMFLQSNSVGSTSVYMLSSKPSRTGKNKWIWIGTVIAAIGLLVIIIYTLCCLQRRKKVIVKENSRSKDEKELLDLVISDESITTDEIPSDGKKGHDVSVFSYEFIMAATNNFSLESKLGEGGFGTVYRGKLLTGQNIAIKRLSRNSGQGINEFKNELILISKLQHTNLVKLLGCCIFGEERMLIYEYMPNKSLNYFLFDSNRSKLLDWKKRFSIIEGIAQGLIYLHKYSRLKVIHRDLKASNILLDESMNPKISDFGMARIFKQNELEANTNRIVGTYGYMSPEYAMEGVFSIKSDVYSFGVLMLEILSGRRNNSFYHADHALNLVGYAWDLWQEGKGLELVDLTIRDSCVECQVLRCIHVSLLCVEDDAVDRPAMSDMLSMLTNESAQLPLPKKPAFSIGKKATRVNTPNNELELHTMNGLSISDIDAR
ncbi:G-type lectin S-receptor-like serine/threonine-protein kinase At1g67520 isoform X1 [Castanea sativa]|uniref:G-type lectin S-receptor-like serine/threonine-protein kinase At1g67520 isoform X1 n=1 Tax=Castanea sativa TaxID=21020 RepID=UPI003F64A5BC